MCSHSVTLAEQNERQQGALWSNVVSACGRECVGVGAIQYLSAPPHQALRSDRFGTSLASKAQRVADHGTAQSLLLPLSSGRRRKRLEFQKRR